MAQPKFELVEEIPDRLPETSNPASDRISSAATAALMLGLKTLSQRAVAGAITLFTLLTVASAFVLWHNTPDPSPTQIASLSLYALFVLAANWIVRRK